MPKIKKIVKTDFTMIHNAMVRDKELGFHERGLLLTMLSLPDTWDFSIRGLMAISTDGYTKISNSLKILEKRGYLKRERVYAGGKIIDWEYYFSDEPIFAADEGEPPPCTQQGSEKQPCTQQGSEKQELENLVSEKQIQDNLESAAERQAGVILHEQINNKENNNQESKNIISSFSKSIHQSNSSGYMRLKDGYTEIVKKSIDYDAFILWIQESNGYMDKKELDEIVDYIVSAICSDKPTETICEHELPREVIRSVMLKVDRTCVENAIDQMRKTDNIRNYGKYLISTLYNEATGRSFRENTEERNAEYAVKRDFGSALDKYRNL